MRTNVMMSFSAAAGARDTIGRGNGGAAVLGASRWLGLAATPAFAAMGLMTAAVGDGAPFMMCSAPGDGPLRGMTAMYALMAVFHLPAWLRLIADRMRSAGG
jgi:hypothetical protein